MLVEQFIEGREFYVGVLGNANAEALPVIELDFTGFPADRPRIASWAAKWGDDGEGSGAEFAGTHSIFPDGAGCRARRADASRSPSKRSTRFGCATTRASICASPTPGEIYVIEVNPNCYLERESEFARAAKQHGLEYDALMARISSWRALGTRAEVGATMVGGKRKAGANAGFFPSQASNKLLALLGGLATSLLRPPFFAAFFALIGTFLCSHGDLSIHGGSCSHPIPRWTGETTTFAPEALRSAATRCLRGGA